MFVMETDMVFSVDITQLFFHVCFSCCAFCSPLCFRIWCRLAVLFIAAVHCFVVETLTEFAVCFLFINNFMSMIFELKTAVQNSVKRWTIENLLMFTRPRDSCKNCLWVTFQHRKLMQFLLSLVDIKPYFISN